MEDTSIKFGAVKSLEGLDCLVVFNVFDEGNTLEGEVLALGHLSEALENFTYVTFVGVLANSTDKEFSLSSILRVDISLRGVRSSSLATTVRSAFLFVRVFVSLDLLERLVS